MTKFWTRKGSKTPDIKIKKKTKKSYDFSKTTLHKVSRDYARDLFGGEV